MSKLPLPRSIQLEIFVGDRKPRTRYFREFNFRTRMPMSSIIMETFLGAMNEILDGKSESYEGTVTLSGFVKEEIRALADFLSLRIGRNKRQYCRIQGKTVTFEK